MVGRLLSHYRIIEQVGSGGMGVVYRAHDESLNRDVAVKVIREGSLADTRTRRRIRTEALALGRLNHPNIETVYEFGHSEDVDFVVTEYVEGDTLSGRIRSGPLPEPEVREIAAQVAAALVEAHDQRIVHCDLKPANIILTPKRRVKVIDFGAAKLAPRSELDSTETRGAEGAISGTLPYMSPERFRGAPATQQSDIYSFGAMVYEMATGQRPFEGESTATLVAAILSQPPPSAREANPAISEDLDRVISRCLQKDPLARYSSAWELLSALTPQTAAAKAENGRSPGDKTTQRRRTRRWAAVTGLSAAVLCIGGALAWWVAENSRVLAFSPRDWVLIGDLENQTGEPIFDRSLYDAFTISVEQSRHANVFPRSRVYTALRRMGKDPPVKVDEQIGRELCIRENIRGLITLSIAKAGRSYALAARLIDPASGDTVKSYLERAGDQDRILDALGSIAGRIRRHLGESLRAIEQSQRPLAQVTTSSLAALKAYSDGHHLWARGEYDAGVRLQEDALRLDPNFAMAHAALGIAYCSHILNNRTKCQYHFRQALENTTRLTDRERLFINAERESSMGSFDNAARLWTVYLNAYPDDLDSRYNFASALMQNERAQDAIRHFQEVLRVAPAYASARINLATSYAAISDYNQALVHYTKAFELEPAWITSTNLNNEYGFTLFNAGNTAKAREVFGLAVAKPEMRAKGLRSLAILDAYQGKWRAAEKGFREAASLNRAAVQPLSEARDRFHLAAIRKAQADRAGAVAELDRAAAALDSDASPQLWLASRVAIGYLRAGAFAKGASLFRKLERGAEPENREQAACVHRAQAELSLVRGDGEQALEFLRAAALEGDPPPLQLASLAHAYDRMGRTEDAIATYQALASMKDRCIGWEAQHACVEAQYRLAELQASRGAGAEALRWVDALERQFAEADEDLLLLQKTRALRTTLRARGL